METAVVAALRDKKELLLPQDPSDDRESISKLIERIEVSRGNIRLIFKGSKEVSGSAIGVAAKADDVETLNADNQVDIEWRRNSHGPLARVEESRAHGNEPNSALVQAVAKAHVWLRLLTNGSHTSIESLAASINMHPKVVRKSIRLAFLAPGITEAILLGHHSKSFLTLIRLHDAHSLSWFEQTRQMCP